MKPKKNLILPLFLVLFAVPSIAETQPLPPQADSIVAVLPQLRGEEKLEALVRLAGLTFRHPYARLFLDKALEEARSQRNVDAEGLLLSRAVAYHFSNLECDSVFIVGEKALRFMQAHQFHSGAFFVQERMITRHIRQENFITALRATQEAYDNARASQDENLVVQVLTLIANIYRGLEQHQEAFLFYMQALDLANSDREAIKREQSLFFVRQYYDLAWAARWLDKPQEMLRFADSLGVEVQRLRELNIPVDLLLFDFFGLFHRAIAYAKLNNPQRSLQTIRRAEEIYEPRWGERNPYFAVKIHDMWGMYYLAIGRYSRAVTHFNLLLDHYKSTNNKQGILLSLNLIARAYYQGGDYRRASNVFLQILDRQNTFGKERFYTQINELRTIFELDNAELEKERRNLIIQRQQFMTTLFLIAFIASLLIVFAVVWNLVQKERKLKQLYLQIKEKDRLQADINTLEHQLKQAESELRELKSEPLPATAELADNLTQHKKIVASLHHYLSEHHSFADPDASLVAEKITTSLATNRAYLYRAVKAVTGQTLQDYINEFQIEKARQMLETTQESVEQIAILCGYKDRSTFYRQFFKRYSMSPTQYKRLAKSS